MKYPSEVQNDSPMKDPNEVPKEYTESSKYLPYMLIMVWALVTCALISICVHHPTSHKILKWIMFGGVETIVSFVFLLFHWIATAPIEDMKPRRNGNE
jgi:pheromone shutdown protein TraB